MSRCENAWATIVIDYPDGKHTVVHGKVRDVIVDNDIHHDMFMDYYNIDSGPGVTWKLRFPYGVTGTTMAKEDA